MIVQLGFQQFQLWIHLCILWHLDLFSSAIVLLSRIWYFICTCLFCFLIMTNERDDSLQSMSVRLDGKHYSYWSSVMRNFLKGKKLWGYVIGTCETKEYK